MVWLQAPVESWWLRRRGHVVRSLTTYLATRHCAIQQVRHNFPLKCINQFLLLKRRAIFEGYTFASFVKKESCDDFTIWRKNCDKSFAFRERISSARSIATRFSRCNNSELPPLNPMIFISRRGMRKKKKKCVDIAFFFQFGSCRPILRIFVSRNPIATSLQSAKEHDEIDLANLTRKK